MSSPLLPREHPTNSPEVAARPGETATLLNAPEFCTPLPEHQEQAVDHLTITFNDILTNTRRESNFDDEKTALRHQFTQQLPPGTAVPSIEAAVHDALCKAEPDYKQLMDTRKHLKEQARDLMQHIRPETVRASLSKTINIVRGHEGKSKDTLVDSAQLLGQKQTEAATKRAASLGGEYSEPVSRESALANLRAGKVSREHAKDVHRVKWLTGSERVLEELYEEVFLKRQETIDDADNLIGNLNTFLQSWDIRDTRPVDPDDETVVREVFNELTAILNGNKLLKFDDERVRLFEESTRLLVRLEERGILADSLDSSQDKIHEHAGYTREGGILLHEGTDREYIAFADGTIGKKDSEDNLQCLDARGQTVSDIKGVAMPESTTVMVDGEQQNHNHLDKLFRTWEESRQPDDAVKLHTFLEKRINYQAHLNDRLAVASQAYVEANDDVLRAQNAPDNTPEETAQKARLIAEAGARFQKARNEHRTTMDIIIDQEGSEDQLRSNRNKNLYWKLRLEVGNHNDNSDDNVEMYPDGAIELPRGSAINNIQVVEWGSFILPSGESALELTDPRIDPHTGEEQNKAHFNAKGQLTHFS